MGRAHYLKEYPMTIEELREFVLTCAHRTCDLGKRTAQDPLYDETTLMLSGALASYVIVLTKIDGLDYDSDDPGTALDHYNLGFDEPSEEE
jgi:hypothetical protein